MRSHLTALLVLVGLSWQAGFAAQPQLVKVSDSVVDPEALYLPDGQWGNTANGQSFQQDALSSFKGWQYATYYDAERRLCLARRRAAEPHWEIIRFEDYHFAGKDTHNVAVVGICPADGTIHLSFDHHVSPLHYRRSVAGPALKPRDFRWTSALFGTTTSDLEPGKELSRVTYPRFLRTPEGTLEFICRIGSSGNGDKCLADYDPKTKTWKNFGPFIGKEGAYGKSTVRNPYLNGLTYDQKGRLHVTWCWRETGDPMTNHDLDYAWSDDQGMTWSNNVGAKIGERGKQLITVNSPDVAVVKIAMNRGLANATAQAVDSHGRPHLVTFHLPDDVPQQPDWISTRQKVHYFHYWRDDHGHWHRNELALSGSRPRIWFDGSDNAYMVITGHRYNPSTFLTIASASAKSGWTDWNVIHREPGPFTGEPKLDSHAQAGTLAIYVQEETKDRESRKSALRVIEFAAKAARSEEIGRTERTQ